MKKHKYFVSYMLIINGDPMPGNMVFNSEKEIKGLEEVEILEASVTKIFKEKCGGAGEAIEGAVLMNFIKL